MKSVQFSAMSPTLRHAARKHEKYIFFIINTANAGEDISIALPDTKTTLNGNKSTDDIKIVSYNWKQLR